jgi:hypothetical protein
MADDIDTDAPIVSRFNTTQVGITTLRGILKEIRDTALSLKTASQILSQRT